MPKPIGLPKTGGRQKGTPNKSTLFLKEQLDSLKLDIPAKLNELLPQLSPEKQIDAIIKLMPFIYPQLKGIEIKIDEPDLQNNHEDNSFQNLPRTEQIKILEAALRGARGTKETLASF